MSIPYERSPDADPENEPADRPMIEQDPEGERELGGGSRRGPGYSEPDQESGDSWRAPRNSEDE